MNSALRSKIIELFEYRKLPALIAFGGVAQNDEGALANDKLYYEQLINLQYQIYKLDHELESNWSVDTSIIEERWEKIYQSLDALNIPREEHDNYCRHIYKYQKHELDIRDLKLPTRLSMEYFYFYKSCDVKLLRKIIYRNNPLLSKAIKESDWRLFDLVTEVNDDVSDLQEDVNSINGNRFLISMKVLGKKATKQIFTEFLHQVQNRNQLSAFAFANLDINRWTEDQVIETIALIDAQVEAFDGLDTSLYDRLSSASVTL